MTDYNTGRPMKLLALVMTLLQGDKTTYQGHLVSTIIGLKCKLSQSTDQIVEPLVKALSAGINSRLDSKLC